jgi:hypothetical protein
MRLGLRAAMRKGLASVDFCHPPTLTTFTSRRLRSGLCVASKSLTMLGSAITAVNIPSIWSRALPQ